MQFELYEDASAVEAAEHNIRKLQSPITSTIYRKPRPDWSP